MRILVTFASSEGQTEKIARFIYSKLKQDGHSVFLQDASSFLSGQDPEGFDTIILAGSVHEDRHQDILGSFVAAHLEALKEKRTLFISVSLSAAFEKTMDIAEKYVDEFCESQNWRPTRHLLVAGAIRHEAYGYYEEMIVQHRVLPKRPVERPEEDQEFTDWEALETAVLEFIAAGE